MGFPDSPVGLPSSTAETVFENLARLYSVPESIHVPSMLLDARRSQPMEVEVIVGEVVRMGKKYNVDMPVSVPQRLWAVVDLHFTACRHVERPSFSEAEPSPGSSRSSRQ